MTTTRTAVLLLFFGVLARLEALPSFARQTGQKCSACHVGGDWPQLTPWGRFFKLSGYTVGSRMVDSEHQVHLPVGLFGQAGLTWAGQPNDTQGQTVVPQNGAPEAYEFTGELATKITDFAGIFYEYQLGNTFPGWKGVTGAADVRAVHFFHVGTHELLAGLDSNNSPTVQDVWNTVPDWSFPFYASPQAPGTPAAPMLASLGSQAGSIGTYVLIDRHLYLETSFYHVGTDFFRWMTLGTAFQNGANYLNGFNPYWRAHWTQEHGPNSWMIGTLGLHSRVFPNSGQPTGPTDLFVDYGVDSQYQHLLTSNKITLRASYIYEQRNWEASFPLGAAGTEKGNAKFLDLNGSYSFNNTWVFHAGYLYAGGNKDAVLYGISDPSGNQVTASPLTTGYALEVDRHVTQNVQLMAQYRGFIRFNGLRHNIDGIGRSASDNNTLWLSVFFAL